MVEMMYSCSLIGLYFVDLSLNGTLSYAFHQNQKLPAPFLPSTHIISKT